jgi:hypothetical protein
MRQRTRANGPQLKCIRIRIGTIVSDIMLTRSSELSDRCKTIARVMMLQEIAQTMIDLQSKEIPSCEMKCMTLDEPTFPVFCEQLGNPGNLEKLENVELVDIFECSNEWEDPFSFL